MASDYTVTPQEGVQILNPSISLKRLMKIIQKEFPGEKQENLFISCSLQNELFIFRKVSARHRKGPIH